MLVLVLGLGLVPVNELVLSVVQLFVEQLVRLALLELLGLEPAVAPVIATLLLDLNCQTCESFVNW